MMFDDASSCFPFNIPIVPLWDGSTYGPWILTTGYNYFLKYEVRYPSASSTEYIPVCGPGTGYNVQFSLDELIEIYWRVRSFNVNASLSDIGFSDTVERKGQTVLYVNQSGSYPYFNPGLAINETDPLMLCGSNTYGLFSITKEFMPSKLVVQNLRVFLPFYDDNIYYDSSYVRIGSPIRRDHDGNYWLNLNISARSDTFTENTYWSNGFGCPPTGSYKISTIKFKVQGYTCGSRYRTDATKPSGFQFTAFGKTVPLYEFEWSWPDDSVPNAYLYSEKIPFGSVDVSIDGYFDYSGKNLLFLKL
jgi:hypothetical protein